VHGERVDSPEPFGRKTSAGADAVLTVLLRGIAHPTVAEADGVRLVNVQRRIWTYRGRPSVSSLVE